MLVLNVLVMNDQAAALADGLDILTTATADTLIARAASMSEADEVRLSQLLAVLLPLRAQLRAHEEALKVLMEPEPYERTPRRANLLKTVTATLRGRLTLKVRKHSGIS